MPSGYDTVCLNAGGGVTTADPSGCAQTLTLEGELRQQIDSFSWTLASAREDVIAGRDPGWGTSRVPPYSIVNDMNAQQGIWCKMYPGSCPTDVASLIQKYVGEFIDLVGQFGFDLQGNYSAARDNQPVDAIFPEDVTPTPLQPNPNVSSYSPSAGWRPPIDALPVTLGPTLPAYTSPSNVAATSPGSPYASGGGTSIAGTASGSGGSQGGSTTQQSRLIPSAGAPAVLASLGGNNQQLLIILLVIAVAIIVFSRGN